MSPFHCTVVDIIDDRNKSLSSAQSLLVLLGHKEAWLILTCNYEYDVY